MKIQCTKKLLEVLKVQPAQQEVEEDALFSWHANILTYNRRKTVVLVNDHHRYVVVLYGLKAKEFKNLDKIVLEGIREAFLAEGIKEEIIEKYLLQSGEFTYTKTKDRTSVARLNKACEHVDIFQDLLDNETIFNKKLSMRVSRSIFGTGKKSYIVPVRELIQSLESFAGESIFSMQAVQLKITLRLDKQNVWRRIVVPLHGTFEDLHETLQVAFGWKDSHLHEFCIFDNSNSNVAPVVKLVCHEEAFAYPSKVEMKLGSSTKLAEYLPTYKQLQYNYDFGDDWQHIIEVERVIEGYDKPYSVCLEGEGNTPPEDVGGSGGYEEFLKIMDDPDHEEYHDMAHWGRMQGYKDFDIELVNFRLKRM